MTLLISSLFSVCVDLLKENSRIEFKWIFHVCLWMYSISAYDKIERYST